MSKYLSLLVLVLAGCSTTPQLSDKDVDHYPSWVLDPEAYYGAHSASSCEEIGKAGEYKSQKLAEQSARLALLKSVGGRQLIHAIEDVQSASGKSSYASSIKLKTYGRIGRNDILKKGVVELSKKKREVCVVVGLI